MRDVFAENLTRQYRHIGDFVVAPFAGQRWHVWEGYRVVCQGTARVCESWARAEIAKKEIATYGTGAADA